MAWWLVLPCSACTVISAMPSKTLTIQLRESEGERRMRWSGRHGGKGSENKGGKEGGREGGREGRREGGR